MRTPLPREVLSVGSIGACCVLVWRSVVGRRVSAARVSPHGHDERFVSAIVFDGAGGAARAGRASGRGPIMEMDAFTGKLHAYLRSVSTRVRLSLSLSLSLSTRLGDGAAVHCTVYSLTPLGGSALSQRRRIQPALMQLCSGLWEATVR